MQPPDACSILSARLLSVLFLTLVGYILSYGSLHRQPQSRYKMVFCAALNVRFAGAPRGLNGSSCYSGRTPFKVAK